MQNISSLRWANSKKKYQKNNSTAGAVTKMSKIGKISAEWMRKQDSHSKNESSHWKLIVENTRPLVLKTQRKVNFNSRKGLKIPMKEYIFTKVKKSELVY